MIAHLSQWRMVTSLDMHVRTWLYTYLTRCWRDAHRVQWRGSGSREKRISSFSKYSMYANRPKKGSYLKNSSAKKAINNAFELRPRFFFSDEPSFVSVIRGMSRDWQGWVAAQHFTRQCTSEKMTMICMVSPTLCLIRRHFLTLIYLQQVLL